MFGPEVGAGKGLRRTRDLMADVAGVDVGYGNTKRTTGVCRAGGSSFVVAKKVNSFGQDEVLGMDR